ncbi:MAG: purine-binding chemotaxis protein CheW [Desulfatibacillum sp.]|nr:purine-binding chemotaxis protein CheW [Desulfatibacillum sp.]
MSQKKQYFVFMLDEQRYGIDLQAVERVIPAVELITLPEAPEMMSGLINLRGRMIPVVDIRKKFRLPPRDMGMEDRIVIFRTSTWITSIVVDKVEGVMEFVPRDLDDAAELFPEMGQFMEGVGKSEDDSVLIYDIDSLFSRQEIHKVSSQVENHSQP